MNIDDLTSECGLEFIDNDEHLLHHLHRIENRLDTLGEQMTAFSSDQAHLDADVSAENDALGNIEAEITALKNQPASAALDFSKLDAEVARVKGDQPAATVPPVPAPTPVPAPSPAPAAPTDPAQPPATDPSAATPAGPVVTPPATA